MKAIAKTKPAFGAEIIDVPVKKPGPGELLVRVAACGICGSDLHIYEWELGADRMVARLPAVIGHEPAGEVVEVGEIGAGVTTFKAGDHVALDPFGHCGNAAPAAPDVSICALRRRISAAHSRSIVIAPIGNSYLVPPTMDFETAALLEPFGTGLHAVEQSCLKAGDSCVVEGPGPIGLSVAMSARALGVSIDRDYRPRSRYATPRARA